MKIHSNRTNSQPSDPLKSLKAAISLQGPGAFEYVPHYKMVRIWPGKKHAQTWRS